MSSTWNLRAAVSDLLGRRQQQLVTELRGQVDAGREAVAVAAAAASGRMPAADARAQVGELEDRGDAHRANLVHTLATTFVIPIDREDLFRFSRSLDDVLDNLRDFCRELDLYGPETVSPLFGPLLEAVGRGMEALAGAVDVLGTDPTAMTRASLRAKKAHNEVRTAYQQAIAELFSTEPTATSMKRRELLRRLDVVSLRMGEAADTLADGQLKRGG